MIKRKLGIVLVTDDASNISVMPKAFNMANLFPIKIESDISTGINRYLCVSGNFDYVNEGDVIPVYDITINEINGDISTVNLEKKT